MGMKSKRKYLELGVDVHKSGVELFKELIGEIYPHAFASIIGDPESNRGFVLHIDGAGSKPIVSYIYYKETGEVKWFKGLVQDIIAMNIDDVITVGAKPKLFADYIALNPLRLPRIEVLREISRGFREVLELLRNNKCPVILAGGETADLPDQLRTIDIVGAVLAEVNLSKAVTGEEISEGDIIIGLSSGGKSKLEKHENSGIMCNGLTLARHALLSKEYYIKYPEIAEPTTKEKYYGRYQIDDYIDELGMTIGEALLSPTRIYAPIIMEIMEKYGHGVKGMVHNTGGGMTKILRLGTGMRYIKDNLPEPNPIFKIIQREGEVDWREMYEVFNMGIGFELIVDKSHIDEIISISEKYDVKAYVIGRIEKSKSQYNELILKSSKGTFFYRKYALN